MIRHVLPFLLLVSVPAFAAPPSEDECGACHGIEGLKAEDGRSLFAVPSQLAGTPHEGFSCTFCHASIDEVPHAEALPPPACGHCHSDALEEYGPSAHGQALEKGDADAPTCGDCHGRHRILPADDPRSAVHPDRLVETCARCHADPGVVSRHPFSVAAPVDAYLESVHHDARTNGGNADAPSCVSCHGSHDIRAARDPESAIYWGNVPATCGKCHEDIEATYLDSVHGKAAMSGIRQAPICTDCHGEHEIRGPDDPESTVYPTQVSKTTCAWCHESVRVTRKFGLARGRLTTYLDSYHGLADKAGSTAVANCASCHGIHDIKPSSDPTSKIHPGNLARTCGHCHPGVGQNVALGAVHVDPSEAREGSLAVFYVRKFYVWLIAIVVGAMLLHNGADFATRFRAARLPDGDAYLRFTVNERIQHAVMAISFIGLAYSGFALKWPEAWWAAPFVWTGQGESARQIFHRTLAVVMVSVCVHHLVYAVGTARGRAQMGEMRPKWTDVRDAVQAIRFYARRTAERPAFARFSYVEKVEYWALVWGSVVMSATGFALWFENASLRLMPKWLLDVATVIHYFEAWLAVLAILVWHFYWVMFNPSVYPMSLVWLTGTLSEEAMKEEHPRELEDLRSEQEDPDDRTG